MTKPAIRRTLARLSIAASMRLAVCPLVPKEADVAAADRRDRGVVEDFCGRGREMLPAWPLR
jgi:hypothetical protein